MADLIVVAAPSWLGPLLSGALSLVVLLCCFLSARSRLSVSSSVRSLLSLELIILAILPVSQIIFSMVCLSRLLSCYFSFVLTYFYFCLPL